MGLPQLIERANIVLDRWLMVITGSALVLGTMLVFIGVLLRYIFKISFEWNEELCRYSMITIVYLWAGAMIRSKQHIYFSLLSDRLQGRSQDIHRFAGDILTVVFGIPILYWGFELVGNAYAAELKTLSLLFPLWPAYSLVPLGVTLIVIQAILDIFRMGFILFSRPKEAAS